MAKYARNASVMRKENRKQHASVCVCVLSSLCECYNNQLTVASLINYCNQLVYR